MGKVVTLDNTICYLTSISGDEILAFPRLRLEPELRGFQPRLQLVGRPAQPQEELVVPDNQADNYLRLSRWDKEVFDRGGIPKYEESIRQLMNRKMTEKFSRVFVAKKLDLERASPLWLKPDATLVEDHNFDYRRFGARQVVNFLNSFCWISKQFEVECLVIGDSLDYQFTLRERKRFTILGRSGGDVVLSFRWSEFQSLTIKLWRHFELSTTVGGYQAWLKKTGTGSFDENSALMNFDTKR